jgi:hypothetical protein
MKLHIVPASRGIQWVKLGVKTFFRQPLALSGLFFMFLAVISVVSMVPLLGSALALALLPGATLGLMAATREASSGKFPMPLILISAFRAGRQQLRSMLVLGALYALGFVLVLGCSTLVDGGKFAKLYLLGAPMTAEVLQQGDFQMAAVVAAVLACTGPSALARCGTRQKPVFQFCGMPPQFLGLYRVRVGLDGHVPGFWHHHGNTGRRAGQRRRSGSHPVPGGDVDGGHVLHVDLLHVSR